jgi:predicted KAP-like P-loop ATPase
LVIGIYGAWGEGKSSVLVLMAQALAAGYGYIVPVPFNPWHFKSEEHLLRGFFATLASVLGRSLPTKRQKLGKLLKRYGALLSVVGVGDAATAVGRTWATVTLDELRGRLEKLLREAGKRVVILIDDIDRLDRREIQAIFKLVKLSANFEHTSYVLAFDDEMVAGALGEQYGAGGVEAGRGFLEKIVQVPLHLPPADQLELQKLIFAGVDAALSASGISLSTEQVEAFVCHFVDGIEPRLTTPRQVKLYVNALTFALPILKGEVHPVDQMLIEGIRVFYPKLYVGTPSMFDRSEGESPFPSLTEAKGSEPQGPQPRGEV